MRHTLTLLAVLVVCGIGVGCGTTAATGPQTPEPVATVDTADRPAEPTGRTYLAAPSTPTPIATTPEPAEPVAGTRSGPSTSVTEAPAPVAVNPQPAPVEAPVDEPAATIDPSVDNGSAFDVVVDERPTCPAPTVVVGAFPDGYPICGAP
jgi:hypothetical protein